jgi:hypothetical protein
VTTRPARVLPLTFMRDAARFCSFVSLRDILPRRGVRGRGRFAWLLPVACDLVNGD